MGVGIGIDVGGGRFGYIGFDSPIGYGAAMIPGTGGGDGADGAHGAIGITGGLG